jgi:amidase
MRELAAHRPAGMPSSDPFVVGPLALAKGAAHGPLAGVSFAAKDLYDVAGTRTGAGNPARLADAEIVFRHADAVAALLAAGGELVGKTVTDELAFSLSGTNVHYGTPENPLAPGCVPGGSSSGSVAAVALGLVDLALGTDTGGSVRVPASYCGVFGIRTTHGRISRQGVLLLAPSFCSVGIFARDAAMLGRGWRALRDGAAADLRAPRPIARSPRRFLLAPELLALADTDAAAACLAAGHRLAKRTGLPLVQEPFASPDEVLELRDAFRTIQMHEAWALHGPWLSERHPEMGPGIAARFAAAAEVTAEQAEAARERRAAFQSRFCAYLGDDGYLLQPAASGPAPAIDLEGPLKDDLRARTLALTAIGGLAGSPVAVAPVAPAGTAPLGLALVGLPGDDDAVVALAGSNN